MTYELEYNGKVYGLSFGMGFVRDCNANYAINVQGTTNKKNIGLSYMIGFILGDDIETLAEVLYIASRNAKGAEHKLTREIIDDMLDDPETDIDGLFKQVLDFFANANCTTKTYRAAVEEYNKLNAKN